MRLPDKVHDAARLAGVKVYYANRSTTKMWNSDKKKGDLTQYGGWYWYREWKGRVTDTDQDGPFRSENAAVRDAFMKLQLRS